MVTIAEEWLNSCSGCEIALLNLGETLLDLLPDLSFVHIPVLADNKYYGQTGERSTLEIPKAQVGIISGGVRNEEHLEVLHVMRKQTDILVALGTCATEGGIPALANLTSTASMREMVYRGQPSTVPGPDPDTETHHLPRMLERCDALHQHVAVDLSIPGCPPHPDWIAEAIGALLAGRAPELPSRSVCDGCPTLRTGKSSSPTLHRLLDQPAYDADQGLEAMQCLLEQGFMCLGPVTRRGCGGRTGSPRCISARVPCRGCYGRISEHTMPMVDYVGALTSVGQNFAAMPDKQGYLSRFDGSEAILKKLED